MLLGDFNGHIREEDGGVPGGDTYTDINGQKVLNFSQVHELKIMNCDDKC